MHEIYEKIKNETVTKEDFDRLLNEAYPESIRDRVRRRLNKKDRDDDEYTAPDFNKRIQPKKDKSSNSQHHGRGKIGHHHSTRSQRQKSRLAEAIEFIKNNYHKKINEDLIKEARQVPLITTLLARMMIKPVDNDWIYKLKEGLDGR